MPRPMSGIAESQKYAEYRAEVRCKRTLGALRSGILIVAGLYTPFLLLDYFAYAETFGSLLAARLSVVGILAVCYSLAPRAPQFVMICSVLSVGFNLIAVIGLVGGVSSLYFPGLMLLFLGMPVILPLTARQSGWVVFTLFIAFACLPLIGAGEFASREYIVNLFFPGAAAAESVFSCALLDRLRFVDFCRTEEIAAARDQLEKLDDAKTRFSANVHHELRTPLTLLLAPLDGLFDGSYGPLNLSIQKVVGTMRSNGERLLRLINNLLDLTKLEDSKFSISRLPLSVADLLEDLASGTSAVAELKGISVNTADMEDLVSVFADRDALDKVFMNLLGNALKFTEPGGSISIEGNNVEGGVVVRVVDSGIGLESSQIERIFDRFAQVDTSTTRKHEGTGIGLSLAAELIQLHGGELRAASGGIGQGTTMTVMIPVGELDTVVEPALLDESENPIPVQSVETAPAAGLETVATPIQEQRDSPARRFADLDFDVRRWADQLGKASETEVREAGLADKLPRVLVVDDNADMRELLRHILEERFSVRCARNGREALEILEIYEPLLVITDIMMPEMSGTELCESIKGSSRLKDIPVMIISSKAEREMKVRGLELGADDYVTKPFHAREVIARATSLVSLREAQQQIRIQNAQLQTAIDELRDAQARLVQSERLAAVGEIAAGIAHEVNNPVNFALNAARALRPASADLKEFATAVSAMDWSNEAELVKQTRGLQDRMQDLGVDELSDSVVELTSIIEQGLERTRRLVGDLRDFASPNQCIESREIDLREAVEETIRLFDHELTRATVALEVSLPEEPMMVSGDEGALGQVILNIVKNAAQAHEFRENTPDGLHPHVWVSGAIEASAVVIEVRDNGPGIDPTDVDRLFEPFFTTKRVGVGTGLGLSTCRGIIAAHGGAIEVDTEIDRGSTFRIRLPRMAKPAPKPQPHSDTHRGNT